MSSADGIARHTPTLSGTKVIRALSIDDALLPHVSDAITSLTEEWGWYAVGDSVDSVVQECLAAVESWYSAMNIGTISYFIGSLPSGWLAMDGSTYSGDDYPELMAMIDSQFKDVGENEFTLPDMGGVFPLASGNSYVLGDTGGSTTVSLTISEIPSHSHTYTPPVANIDLESPGAPDVLAAGVGSSVQTGSTGNGDAHENMPPYVVLVAGVFSGRI